MSGNLRAVFSIENDSVEIERFKEGLQGHRGLGPISQALQFLTSKIERTKKKNIKYKY